MSKFDQNKQNNISQIILEKPPIKISTPHELSNDSIHSFLSAPPPPPPQEWEQ